MGIWKGAGKTLLINRKKSLERDTKETWKSKDLSTFNPHKEKNDQNPRWLFIKVGGKACYKTSYFWCIWNWSISKTVYLHKAWHNTKRYIFLEFTFWGTVWMGLQQSTFKGNKKLENCQCVCIANRETESQGGSRIFPRSPGPPSLLTQQGFLPAANYPWRFGRLHPMTPSKTNNGSCVYFKESLCFFAGRACPHILEVRKKSKQFDRIV